MKSSSTLYNLLSYLKKSSVMYDIHTAKDYELFIDGYCFANIIYKSNDIDFSLYSLDCIRETINKTVPNCNSMSWGAVIDIQQFYPKEGKEKFYTIYENCIKTSSRIQDVITSNYVNEMKDKVSQCKDFKFFLDDIISNPYNYKLKNIKDLYCLYLGFSFWGSTIDIQKDAISISFREEYDKTFIDFLGDNSNFSKYCARHAKIKKSGIYSFYNCLGFYSDDQQFIVFKYIIDRYRSLLKRRKRISELS